MVDVRNIALWYLLVMYCFNQYYEVWLIASLMKTTYNALQQRFLLKVVKKKKVLHPSRSVKYFVFTFLMKTYLYSQPNIFLLYLFLQILFHVFISNLVYFISTISVAATWLFLLFLLVFIFRLQQNRDRSLTSSYLLW